MFYPSVPCLMRCVKTWRKPFLEGCWGLFPCGPQLWTQDVGLFRCRSQKHQPLNVKIKTFNRFSNKTEYFKLCLYYEIRSESRKGKELRETWVRMMKIENWTLDKFEVWTERTNKRIDIVTTWQKVNTPFPRSNRDRKDAWSMPRASWGASPLDEGHYTS